MSNFSILAIEKNMAFSAKSVTAYYSLPPARFDFASDTSLVIAALSLNGLLSSLSSQAGLEINAHLVISSTPMDVEGWYLNLKEHVTESERSDYLLDAQKEILQRSRFTEKEVYLGIELGNRAGIGGGAEDVSMNPLAGVMSSATKAIDRILDVRDGQISAYELKMWQKREERVASVIMNNNALQCTRVSPHILAQMVSQSVNPLGFAALSPTVSKWGTGALKSLMSCEVKIKPNYLEFTYPDDSKTFMATLCFARFPTHTVFPEANPWILATQILVPTSRFFSRFKLVSPDKVRDALGKNIKIIEDEEKNAEIANHVSYDILERASIAKELEHRMSKETDPWVYGNHRVVLSARTLKELKDQVATIRQHFHQRKIELAWTMGDQWKLFLESMPADFVRVDDFTLRQTLPILGGGFPHGSSTVGDRIDEEGLGWRGSMIGVTVGNLSQAVFFDGHSLLARNKAPGICYVGASGSGKSFAAYNDAIKQTLLGSVVAIIDHKDDSLGLANIPELKDISQVYAIASAPKGVIDPFVIYQGNPEQGQAAALDAISTILGPSAYQEYRIQITTTMSDYMAMTKNPSLMEYTDFIRRTSKQGSKEHNLFQELSNLATTEFASLMFYKPDPNAQITPLDSMHKPGLTIISLMGITLPPSSKPIENYTNKERTGLTILNLVLDKLSVAVMRDKKRATPASLYFDEFQYLAATEAGRSKVDYLLRQCRTKNTNISVMTQSPSDVSGFMQNISSRFIFTINPDSKSFKGEDEMEHAAKLLNISLEDAQETLPMLGNGVSVFRDVDGRVSKVKFFSLFEHWLPYLETNPIKRARLENS